MNSRIARTAYVPGSLATSRQRPAFRVIEGGRGAAQRHGVRVSRTDHAVILCAALAMTLLLGALWHQGDVAAERRIAGLLAQATTEVVTVMPGDSVWAIAEAHPIEGCTTQQVARHIIADNGLASAALVVGTTLRVPQGPVAS